MICVAVTYVIQPGREAEAVEYLRQMTPPTRAEVGNIMYQAHRSRDDPRKFYLYEQYVDLDAFEAHRASAHFNQYVANGLLKIMESRTAEFYEPLES